MATLVIQVNGRVRDRITAPMGIDDEARLRALDSAGAQCYLGGQAPRRIIVVPGRIVNLVV